MADFEMKNFHHFPMKKTSYDLKLELLEEIAPKEAMELMKVDKEFRAVYGRDSWRICGQHVYAIIFLPLYIVKVQKVFTSVPFLFDIRFHAAFFEKIRGCTKIETCSKVYKRTQEEIETERRTMSNLDFVNEAGNGINSAETLKDYFTNFKGLVTERITLALSWYSWQKNDPTSTFLTNVFETRLWNCKEISLSMSPDQFFIFCKLLSETRFEMASLEIWVVCGWTNMMNLDWIFQNGIPGKNRWPAIYVQGMPSWRFTDHLSEFPGVQEATDSLLEELRGIGAESLKKYLSTRKYSGLVAKMRFYRKKIDEERDCIYACYDKSFFAKYVPTLTQ